MNKFFAPSIGQKIRLKGGFKFATIEKIEGGHMLIRFGNNARKWDRVHQIGVNVPRGWKNFRALVDGEKSFSDFVADGFVNHFTSRTVQRIIIFAFITLLTILLASMLKYYV